MLRHMSPAQANVRRSCQMPHYTLRSACPPRRRRAAVTQARAPRRWSCGRTRPRRTRRWGSGRRSGRSAAARPSPSACPPRPGSCQSLRGARDVRAGRPATARSAGSLRPAPLAPRPRAANPWWRHRAPLPLLNESRQLSPTGCHAQVTSLAIQATAAPTHASHRAHAQAPAPPPPPARARLHAHVIYPARCHRASWGWARRAGHHTGPILPGNRTPYIRSL